MRTGNKKVHSSITTASTKTDNSLLTSCDNSNGTAILNPFDEQTMPNNYHETIPIENTRSGQVPIEYPETVPIEDAAALYQFYTNEIQDEIFY